MCILDILKGHNTNDTAIKSTDITFITGYRGIDIRAEINRLRTHGVPICSSNKGYYYTTDKKELKRTIATLQSRVSAINEAIEGLNKAVMKLEVEENEQ